MAPMFAARNVVHCAATCIIGDVGNQTPAPVSARARRRASSMSSSAAHGGDEQVGLAPQHRLRVTGRPAGARDVEVVGVRVVGCALRSGRNGLVVDRSRQGPGVGAVVDLDEQVEPVEHVTELRSERPFVHHAARAPNRPSRSAISPAVYS